MKTYLPILEERKKSQKYTFGQLLVPFLFTHIDFEMIVEKNTLDPGINVGPTFINFGFFAQALGLLIRGFCLWLYGYFQIL